jgi:hypothetical protein
VGGTAPPPADPGRFMVRVVTQVVANDYAAAWTTLHPAHKRVAPRSEYVACELRNPVAGTLSGVRLMSVADRRFAMPGKEMLVRGKAIRVRITLVDPATNELMRTTQVFHAVAVERRWTWILPERAYNLYRTDSCVP